MAAKKKKQSNKLLSTLLEWFPVRNPEVPSMTKNFKRSFGLLRKHKGAFAKVVGIYAGLYFLFVRTITAINLEEISEIIRLQWGDGEESFTTRTVLAAELFGESFNFNQDSGFYFLTLFFITSLALIWLLRNYWAGAKTTVKEAYYQGMYPLVPVLLISILIMIQATPMALASFLMQISFSNGLAVTFIEKVGVLGGFLAAVTVSVYWICGSIIAFYGVTVPGVTPIMALRSAKEILRGRRFAVVRQIIIFIFISSLVALSVLVGVIYVIPDAAIVAVTLLVITMVPWTHLYCYGLYRDLIDE